MSKFSFLLRLTMVFLFFSGLETLTAQDTNTDSQGSSSTETADNKGPFRYFDVSPGLRVWGAEADMTLGFRLFEGVDTALWLRLSAAYGGYGFYRLPDGSMYSPNVGDGITADKTSDATQSDRTNIRWGAGILQGLHFNEKKDRNDLDLLIAWTAWLDIPDEHTYDYQPLVQQSSYPGTNPTDPGSPISLLLHTFLLDVLYDGTDFDVSSKTKQGIWLDTGVTWAPEAINTGSGANFVRLSVSSNFFLPVFKNVTQDNWNLFSGYFAAFAGVDQLVGLGTGASQGIPYPMSQWFGSRFYRDGLGGSLRGMGDGYLDGTTKLIANLEFRLIGPAFITQNINPIAVIYFDTGYFANPPGLPAGSDPVFVSGLRASTGLGLFVNLLDIGSIGLYTQLMLVGNKYDGAKWTPVAIGFNMHF